MNKRKVYAYILSVGLCIFGCGGDEEESSTDQAYLDEVAIQTYLEENGLTDVTERDDSGIYYQITTANPSGQGPRTSDVLSIYYIANALNEQPFDAVINDGTNAPVKLQHYSNSVYPIGLDRCLDLIKEGETAIFYIPSELAYGDMEDLSSIIPPNSVIVMEVELSDIQSEDEVLAAQTLDIEQFITFNNLNDTAASPVDSVVLLSSGVYYKRTQRGIADSVLTQGEETDIKYLAYSLANYPNGTPLDGTASNEVFTFAFNEGEVIAGLDAGLVEMERGEHALLIMPSRNAYGQSAFVIPRNRKTFLVEQDVIPEYASKVSPYQVLVFDLELLQPQNATN
ncbi:hypothetical protein BFP72_07530 [Reichenbachiella sp. 5M10]|uniref:FKBP-type peptidyl-prolyl cis-trans isomerase n=1 Tax=Reichenbachiella sp. 5M10 TaxID=1889772 RepID=UPI000C1453F2|nr:FKBP-type peptidyl-prolyl cis-trans isomerase [Reichenbachiella sp. 5M10]PIB35257.1 hypothetical protein BFP72_07530 [Reichenbachiella sp. 5M10]